MKRLLLCVLTIVLLCGCSFTPNKHQLTQESNMQDVSFPTESPQTETTLVTDTTDVLLDGTGMIPLLFLKTDIFKDRAYLLAAGKDGVVYGAEQFAYSSDPLHISDEIESLKEKPVTTPILEDNRQLQFISTSGQSFFCYHNGITATEETAVNHTFLYAYLPENTKMSDGSYLGSYADVKIFPEKALYLDGCIELDLDQNNELDRISWEYVADTAVNNHPSGYDDYLYDYKLAVERNGAVYIIPNNNKNLVVKNGLQVFAADVDQDGEYEIVVFETMITNSCYGTIFGWNGSAYELQQYCTVAPLP